MIVIKKEDILILLTSIIIFLFYFIGFYFNENSAGAGGINGDFALIWLNLQLFENDILGSLDSTLYNDSRTPIAYILHVLFNPFIESQYQFRLSVLFISLLCPIFFYFSLKIKYKNINQYVAIFISSLILLSPYFRTSAYWGLGENYGILFLLISYLIFEKKKYLGKNLNFKQLFNLFLLSFSSSLCLYFDQKLVIVPFFCFCSIIFNKKINSHIKILLTLFYVIFSIPFLYMIYLWGGILPPLANNARQPSSEFHILNIGYAATIIAFYLLPFLLFFQKKNLFFLFINFFRKKNIFYFILFFIYLFFVLFFSNFFELNDMGKGWFHKLTIILFDNKNIQYLVTLLFFFISWIFICIYLGQKVFDKIIIYFLLIMPFFVYPLYQEYFDPLMIILIFTFLQKKIFINNKNVFILSIYLFILLILSNLFYL